MTTLPQAGPKRRLVRPSLPVIIAIVLVLALVTTLVARQLTAAGADPLAGGTAVAASRGDLVLSISATGAIEPRESSELAFPSQTGRIGGVLVQEGDVVTVGQPLIQLEASQLAAAVKSAEAALAQAQADRQGLLDGATPEQVAAAQAQVAQAQGRLTQTQGSVTRADIQAAQAAVTEARERLAKLLAGPKDDARTRAQTALTQAQADLDRQRAQLSAAKEEARQAIEAQANAVREAQAAYSAAYWDLEFVKEKGYDPRTSQGTTDAQTRDFVDALEQARRTLADAESRLQQDKIAYETAKQNEIAGLADAEARVRAAQADLDELLSGADRDELAAARAQLAQAEASLASLQGAGRQGAIVADQAAVAQAEAQLKELLADPTASDLARAEAQVAQAEAQLEQARIELEQATLKAPFAGVVAAVNVAPGESISQRSPLTLIDVSRYVVKVTVDEVDVARVQVGQPVEVLIDALGQPALDGVVRLIAPQSKEGEAVTAYGVTVEVDPGDRPVKVGMTASASIISDKRAGVVSVPAAAVRSENGQSVVSVVTQGADGKQQVTPQPVEVGLRTRDRVEIRSGLSEGQQVLIGASGQ